MAGDKEAVGHTQRIVDELAMSKKERTRQSSPPRSFAHILPASSFMQPSIILVRCCPEVEAMMWQAHIPQQGEGQAGGAVLVDGW